MPILCGSRRMVRAFHVLWGCEAKHEAGVGGACCACCARTSRVARPPGAMAAPAQAPVTMKEAMLVRANRKTEEKRTRERMDGKTSGKRPVRRPGEKMRDRYARSNGTDGIRETCASPMQNGCVRERSTSRSEVEESWRNGSDVNDGKDADRSLRNEMNRKKRTHRVPQITPKVIRSLSAKKKDDEGGNVVATVDVLPSCREFR